MRELTVELLVQGPGGRFITVPELEADSALLRSLELDLAAEPDGGLSITDDVDLVLVEDSLTDAAGFFLDDLPDLLRAGKGGRYKFRTGPESTSVEVDGEAAVIVGYDGLRLGTTVTALLAALASARQQYETLERLVRSGDTVPH